MLKFIITLTKVKKVVAFLTIAILLTSCSKKGDSVIPPVVETKTLKEKALFPIGAAVTIAHLKETDFASAFKKSYTQLSAEYEMKMKQIWTSSASYAFDNPDYLVNFGTQNSIRVHGHTLVWYSSFPDWFKTEAYDSTNFENNVKNYIHTIVGRYKGKIVSWDVANEIFADNGSLRVDSTVYKTFKDPIAFYGRCFQYTKDADPNVKLFYNDYSVVIEPGKRYAIKQMVKRFKEEGYPIDGLGDQFHYKLSTDKTTMRNGLIDMASTGLLIHISELDIRVNVDRSDSYVFSTSEQQKQSDFYKAIVQMYEELPQEQKFAITTWGVTDKYTWLTDYWNSKEYPLLFDRNYIRKKAYDGFLSGLK